MKIISKITLPTKFEGLQMSLFDLNQTCETGYIENCEIWIFSGTCLLYYCIKSFKRVLMLYKKIKVLWFKKTRTSCKERFFYTDNPGKNYWKKFKKSSKIEKTNKIDICYYQICCCYDQNFIYGRETRHEVLSPRSFDISQICPILLRL